MFHARSAELRKGSQPTAQPPSASSDNKQGGSATTLSLEQRVDQWVEAEEEKLRIKLAGLQQVFGDVDEKYMESTLRANEGKHATSKDLHTFIRKQKEAKKERSKMLEEEKLKAQREEEALAEANRQQLMKRFAILPREEVAEIFEECDRDFDKTVNELLIIVAMVENQREEDGLPPGEEGGEGVGRKKSGGSARQKQDETAEVKLKASSSQSGKEDVEEGKGSKRGGSQRKHKTDEGGDEKKKKQEEDKRRKDEEKRKKQEDKERRKEEKKRKKEEAEKERALKRKESLAARKASTKKKVGFKEGEGDGDSDSDDGIVGGKGSDEESKEEQARLEEELKKEKEKKKEEDERKSSLALGSRRLEAPEATSSKDVVDVQTAEKADEEIANRFLLASMRVSTNRANMAQMMKAVKLKVNKDDTVLAVAQEQFKEVPAEKVEAILEAHDYNFDASLNELIELSEAAKVKSLMQIFVGEDIAESEVRSALVAATWKVPDATLALTALVEERKKAATQQATNQLSKSEPATPPATQQPQPQQPATPTKKTPPPVPPKTTPTRGTPEDESRAKASIGQKFEQKVLRLQQEEEQKKRAEIQEINATKKVLASQIENMIGGNNNDATKKAYVAPPRRPLQAGNIKIIGIAGPGQIPGLRKSDSPTAAPSEGAGASAQQTAPQGKDGGGEGGASPATQLSAEESKFVDKFLEVRKARAVGAAGRRRPTRRHAHAPGGAAAATTTAGGGDAGAAAEADTAAAGDDKNETGGNTN